MNGVVQNEFALRRAPVWDRWRLMVPAAAVGWVWLLSAAWHQQPDWRGAAVIALGGWGLALLTRTAEASLSRVPAAAATGTLLALLAAGGAVWKLPRLFVLTLSLVAVLALLQLATTGALRRPWLFRLMISGLAFLTLVTLMVPGTPWPPLARWGAAALVLLGYMQLWQSPPDPLRLRRPVSGLRGLVFAAAVLSPTSWYAAEGLLGEFLRWENALFAAVAILAAALSPRWRAAAADPPGEPHPQRPGERLSVLSALALCAAGMAGTALTEHPTHRPIFLAGAVAAGLLAAGGACAAKRPRLAAILGEAALLSPWILLPWIPWIVPPRL